MITDFHSHIMPGFDDGAKDVQTALSMIKKSREQGVDTIVSTSHCYPYSGHDIDKFVAGRAEAYHKLMSGIAEAEAEVPEIKLGCEVHVTCDLTGLRGIKRLCIADTDYMLIEMPAGKWTDSVVDNVYKLSISGIKPIIAHAERNLGQAPELLNALYMLDVLIQINAESFGIAPFKKFINNMMKNKMIHVIGTDMHNMTNRPPNMDKAIHSITKRYGEECLDYLMGNAAAILGGAELSYRDLRSFSQKSIFKKPIFGK